MKPLIMVDILNYGMTTSAQKYSTQQDCTDANYNPNTLSLEYQKWQSIDTDDMAIYTEISESDSISCACIIGANFTSTATVVLSGSNTDSPGFFETPEFSVELIYVRGKWLYISETPLPSAQYYRFYISDPNTTETKFKISRILLGKSEQLKLEIEDGYTMGIESLQKRADVESHWSPGTKDPNLQTFDFSFRPCAAESGITSEIEAKQQIDSIYKTVRSSQPFLFIFGIGAEDMFCEYVTINSQDFMWDVSEAGEYRFTLSLKEQV